MKRSVAARCTRSPPATDPVNATKSIPGLAISRAASPWEVCRVWKTPTGRPASSKPAAKRSAQRGVWEEWRRMTALPASRPGTIELTAVRSG
jgi:hypothetical protein